MDAARNVRILIVLSSFSILCAGGCGWWNRDRDAPLKLSGNIEITQVNVAFKISGKVVDLPIREGELVRKGAVVARLDPVQTERQRERELASVAAAESQLGQLKTSIAFQQASLAAEIELRQAELRQAEARLQELLAGARKQEIEQAAAAALDARVRRQQAQRDWERAQALFKRDNISAAEQDRAGTALEAADAALQQAEERLALVKEGPRREEIEAARAQVERIKASLKLTEAGRLEIRRKEQELETRRAEIERARAQVALLDAQLQDTVFVSPVEGVVLVKSAEVGEVVAPGATLATLGDLAHPWLRAYIAEQDLGRVKLGARARVTTDSYPGKTYWGRVSFIASEAEFTPKQIQTPEERVKLVYRIKIDLENPQYELKSNMPADAEILESGAPEKTANASP
jgi:HlyD family secretion protein